MFRLAGEVAATHDGIAEDLRRLVGPSELAARAAASLSPRVAQAAREMATAAERYADAVIEHRRREAHAAITSHRVRDVLRRPESTAEYSDDDALRGEAKALVAELRTWGRGERERVSRELREARRQRARAERAIILSEQKVRAELLLAERGRVMVGLDMTLRKLTDGRLSEGEWRRKGDDYMVRREMAERLREGARIDILGALEPLGTKEAASCLRDLEHGLRREGALKRLRAERTLRADQVRRAETAAAELKRAAAELAVVEGEERRRRRVEADEDLRRRRIRSDPEDRKLMATLHALRREISDIDRRIIADPVALAMAAAEGLGERIGRESQMIEDALRPAEASDGIQKPYKQSADPIGKEKQPAIPQAQNGSHTAEDGTPSPGPDEHPPHAQGDAPKVQEGARRKLGPRTPGKPDRSR